MGVIETVLLVGVGLVMLAAGLWAIGSLILWLLFLPAALFSRFTD